MSDDMPYDYRELAYDLYDAGANLLEDLVALRKRRHMTQQQLAEEMNVSQSYVSQIENGKTNLVSLLTDYALEVGARITYAVEPAEYQPQGCRHTFKYVEDVDLQGECGWDTVSVASPAATTIRSATGLNCTVWITRADGNLSSTQQREMAAM